MTRALERILARIEREVHACASGLDPESTITFDVKLVVAGGIAHIEDVTLDGSRVAACLDLAALRASRDPIEVTRDGTFSLTSEVTVAELLQASMR